MKLKEQFDTTTLNELCNLLSQEIINLSTAEYKLKLAFVLVHIIEESQKALNGIDTSNFLDSLKKLVNEACEKSEKQKETLVQKFSKNRELIGNIIEGKNDEFEILQEDIENKLEQRFNLGKELARVRDNMKPEDVKRSKQK